MGLDLGLTVNAWLEYCWETRVLVREEVRAAVENERPLCVAGWGRPM